MTSAPPARTLEVRHLQIARAAFAATRGGHGHLLARPLGGGRDGGLQRIRDHDRPRPPRRGVGGLPGRSALAGRAARRSSRSSPAWSAASARSAPITGFFATVIAWALVSGADRGDRRDGAPSATRSGPSRAFAARSRPESPTRGRSRSPDPCRSPATASSSASSRCCSASRCSSCRRSTPCSTRSTRRREPFTLTGITIGVGIFGAYAAIVAVYLAIAGFSPRKALPVTTEAHAPVPADQKDPA